MRQLLIILLISIFGQTLWSQTAAEQIKTLMHEQELAWNRADLEGFMIPYWHSDSLKFVGSKGVTYGWDKTLKNYQKNYNSPEKMGQLHFKILSFELLSDEAAFLIGSWALTREHPVGGHFTLLWKKIEGKWQIVCDHTS